MARPKNTPSPKKPAPLTRVKCAGPCGVRRAANRFRFLTLRNGKKIKSPICMSCDAPFISIKRPVTAKRDKPHRGPIDRVYFEDEIKVVVLPPSNGTIR